MSAARPSAEDPRIAYFGWSPDIDDPDKVTEAMALDRDLWAQTNPALGIRISEEYVAAEQRSLGARSFAVERLGVGDWPDPDDEVQRKISLEAWKGCEDIESSPVGRVWLAVDVTEDRSAAAIGVAGARPDGLAHLESVPWRALDEVATDVPLPPKPRGTAWVKTRLPELCARHEVVAVLFEGSGPAASLLAELAELPALADVKLVPIKAGEHAQACGMLVDAVDQHGVRHLGQPDLERALQGAGTRRLGDAWAWARRASDADISPLVSVTFALFGLRTVKTPAKPTGPSGGPRDFRIVQL